MNHKHLFVFLFAIFSVFYLEASQKEDRAEPCGLFDIEEDFWYGTNPPEYAPNWDTKNEKGVYYYYYYTVTKAPEKYENFIGTTIFYPINNNVGNMWRKSCKKSILLALDYEEFHTFQIDNRECICTELDLNSEEFKFVREANFIKTRKAIYHILSHSYVGYKDMKARGFSKAVWNTAKSYDEMKEILDKYVNDNHLNFHSQSFYYRRAQKFDEGAKPSADPEKTCRIKETSNTFYIRYNTCDAEWYEYQKMPLYAYSAEKKDFIVLDFRSNNGGFDGPQFAFFQNLEKEKYKGTIYILQDNWSYSSGESWYSIGKFKDLNFKLVGTHSGGMQYYGNCRTVTKDGVVGWVPSTSFVSAIPANYLGEGIGYEPEIWATTENMKSVLEDCGLDLEDIIFL